MDTALLAIILGLAMLAIVPFLLLILRARDTKAAQQPLASGPRYAHNPAHADYYRPNLDTNREKPIPRGAKQNDPRYVPLPKCPQCGAAAGFEESKCAKCGHSLRAPPR
jgi:hypothetical protein